jgi:hypothetical protein
LQWEDLRRSLGDEAAGSPILDGRRLAVGGSEFQLRVYDALSGELVGERLNQGFYGRSANIAADDGTIYAVAEAWSSTRSDSDFLVHAYRESASSACCRPPN